MNIIGFLPQSFCDWPGRASAVLFTPGCNFKCGFCHNPELINFKETEHDETIFNKLKDLEWSLEGVVITGGEPTLQPDLLEYCKKLKSIGYAIKLDSNGSNPEVLQKIINEKAVDYIAMDLKTNMDNYTNVTKFENLDNIKKSIEIIINSGIDHEFRTTFVPDIMTQENIRQAVKEIKGAKRYSLQKFVPKNCLDEKFNSYKSPSHDQLKEIANSLDFKGEIRLRDGHKETIFKKAE